MFRSFILLIFLISGTIQAKTDIHVLLKQKDSIFQKDGIFEKKIAILNDISTYYFIIDDSLNFAKYAYKALSIAKRMSKDKQIDVLNHMSFIYSYRSRKNLSREYAQKAFELSNSGNYTNGIAEALFNLGYSATRKDIEASSKYYIKAINLSREIGSDFVYAVSNAFMGDIYSYSGNYNNAIKYLLTAQKAFDQLLKRDKSLKNLYYYGEMLNSIGTAYKKHGNYNEAEQYYEKYKSTSYNLDNGYGVGIALNNLGVIHTHKKEFGKAIGDFMQAMNVFETAGINIYSGTIYNNLGSIYSDLKNYVLSDSSYQKAYKFYMEMMDSNGQAMVLGNIAVLRLIQGKFKIAEQTFFKAMDVWDGNNNDIPLTCYQGLSQLYDSLNNNTKAYHYFKLYSQLKDTMSELTKAEEIGTITQNYKNERMIEDQKRREREEQEIKTEKMNRKYNLEYMAILILLLFLFAFIIFYNRFKVSTANIESIVFVALLFLFEFIMVFLDPYLNRLTAGEPVFNLMFNGAIALTLTPLDTYLERIIRHRR